MLPRRRKHGACWPCAAPGKNTGGAAAFKRGRGTRTSAGVSVNGCHQPRPVLTAPLVLHVLQAETGISRAVGGVRGTGRRGVRGACAVWRPPGRLPVCTTAPRGKGPVCTSKLRDSLNVISVLNSSQGDISPGRIHLPVTNPRTVYILKNCIQAKLSWILTFHPFKKVAVSDTEF